MSASLCPAGIYALTPKLITIAVDPAPPTQQGGHTYDLQSVNKVELVITVRPASVLGTFS